MKFVVGLCVGFAVGLLGGWLNRPPELRVYLQRSQVEPGGAGYRVPMPGEGV